MTEEKKIQWHPGFCSAMKLELRDNRNDLDYINEYNLNTKPLQVDLLVIRKNRNILIQNEIGRMFKGHNILEYKSPDDDLNIDTYYKVLAYACLYKANGEHVDSVKAEDITISLIREGYPRELMKFFKTNGYVITHPFPGIYYINKDGLFDTQIIVCRQLMGASHVWMKSLTAKLKHKNAQELLYNLKTLTGNADKEYGDSVLSVAMEANPVSFDIWKKEDTSMCEALRRLMQPEIDEAKNEGKNEAKTEAKRNEATQLLTFVQNVSKNSNISIEAACKLLEVPMERYLNAQALLDNASPN